MTSRQVRRQEQRRENKQPVDVDQRLWHSVNKYPKIGIGRIAKLRLRGKIK